LIDQETKLPYYLNESQNLSSWKRPVTIEDTLEISKGLYKKSSHKVENVNRVLEEDVEHLRTGWVKMIDESSQSPYYFNQIENKTTWDKPFFVKFEKTQYVITKNEEQEENGSLCVDKVIDLVRSANNSLSASSQVVENHRQRHPVQLYRLGLAADYVL